MLKMILIGAVAVPTIAAGSVAATGVVVVDVREARNGQHIVVPVPLALSVLPESGNQFSASQAVGALQHARLTEIVNVQGRDGEQVTVTVY